MTQALEKAFAEVAKLLPTRAVRGSAAARIGVRGREAGSAAVEVVESEVVGIVPFAIDQFGDGSGSVKWLVALSVRGADYPERIGAYESPEAFLNRLAVVRVVVGVPKKLSD
jgi:hypothetical protein